MGERWTGDGALGEGGWRARGERERESIYFFHQTQAKTQSCKQSSNAQPVKQ